jgi:dihydroorotate dehydrogenase electron transfer subunit
MTAQLELGVVAMREELMPGVWLLRIHSPAIAAAGQPGQFVHIHCSDSTDPLLRRPFSFAGIDREAGTYDIIFNVVGTGTAMLAAAEAGQHFEALGPLGHPFTFPERGAVLAVAGGLGVAPFPLVARTAIERGLRFVWMNGAYTAHQLLPLDLLPAGVEAHAATDDGSAGHHGLVTELLAAKLAGWVDVEAIHACGPTPMLSALAALLHRLSEGGAGIPACDVSLEAPMGCALGTCLGCVVPSSGMTPVEEGSRVLRPGSPGYVRVCVEGAVMDWRMVDWSRYRALGELVHHRTAPERPPADAVVAQ